MKVVTKCPPSSLKRKRNNCSLSVSDNIFKDQRSIANIRERQRTQTLNCAFESLKKSIPTLSTDKMSKIQTLKIAYKYIKFLNLQLNGEPVEKFQYQEELRRAFSIWRMENEQVMGDDQMSSEEEKVASNQVTSSSDFIVKEEFDKDSFDNDSFEKSFYSKDFQRNSFEGLNFERNDFDSDNFVKDSFDHKINFIKNEDSLNNVVVDC